MSKPEPAVWRNDVKSAVQALENLLEEAKRGEINVFIITCGMADGRVRSSGWGSVDDARELMAIAAPGILAAETPHTLQ